MGGELFDRFPAITEAADDALGYSIKTLCLEDPDNQLTQTQFTQPALFTVNALSYSQLQEEGAPEPQFAAGHSLGEYNALLAAGVLDFATGIQLVHKRGTLMSKATGGGMAAVIGLSAEQVQSVIEQSGLKQVWVANLNTPTQTVITGNKDEVTEIAPNFKDAGARLVVPLKVSGAFHSPLMASAREEYTTFLQTFTFHAPKITVVSNVAASPYPNEGIADLLAEQITSSVRWADSMQFLLGQSEVSIQEVGPGKVLTKMLREQNKPSAA